MSKPDDTVWLMGPPKDGDVVIARCSRCSKRLDIEMKIHPLKAAKQPSNKATHLNWWAGGVLWGVGTVLLARFFLGC